MFQLRRRSIWCIYNFFRVIAWQATAVAAVSVSCTSVHVKNHRCPLLFTGLTVYLRRSAAVLDDVWHGWWRCYQHTHHQHSEPESSVASSSVPRECNFTVCQSLLGAAVIHCHGLVVKKKCRQSDHPSVMQLIKKLYKNRVIGYSVYGLFKSSNRVVQCNLTSLIC